MEATDASGGTPFHAACFAAVRGYDRVLWSLGKVCAQLSVEVFVLLCIRIVCIRYGIGYWFFFGGSNESMRMNFWEAMDPSPNRDEVYSYYGFDDGGDDAYADY